jgi:amidophosphoribosyltransferase
MRTFIMSGRDQRRRSVWCKLTAVAEVVRGRNVLFVDDSIVRGTTSQEIVSLVRKAGAKSVVFASASPPIRHCHLRRVMQH